MRRVAPIVLAVIAAFAVAAAAALGACGDGSKSNAATDSCPLTEAYAKHFLHASVVIRGTPPTLPGVAPPRTRCMYASADKSVQLTIFTGSDLMKRLGLLVQSATTVPALGADARCTATSLGGLDGGACLFLYAGDTYVLNARVPPTESQTLLADVTKLAEQLVAK